MRLLLLRLTAILAFPLSPVAKAVAEPVVSPRAAAPRIITDGEMRAILAALDDPSPAVRDSALGFCSLEGMRYPEFSWPAESALRGEISARVSALLSSGDMRTMSSAAQALGKVGGATAGDLAALGAHLQDPDPQVKRQAAAAFGALGPLAASMDVTALAAILRSPNREVRDAAAHAMGALGPAAAPHVAALAPLLRDTETNPQTYVLESAAASALARLGAAAGPAVPGVIALFRDPERGVRDSASGALRVLGAVAAPHTAELVALLRDPDVNVKRSAARSLGHLGEALVPHLPEIGALLRDPDNSMRIHAAYALGRVGPAATPYASEIGALLQDPDEYVRKAAVAALGGLGPAAAPFTPRIIELVKIPDPRAESDDNYDGGVARRAISTLRGMGPAIGPYLGEVFSLLRVPDRHVIHVADTVLSGLGPEVAPYSAVIVVHLHDPDISIRAAAVAALGGMGAAADPHVPALIALLRDPVPFMKTSAAQALGRLGEVTAPHASGIAALLYDTDPATRGAAVTAQGGSGDAHLREIGELLRDPDAGVRKSVLAVLGGKGAAAAPYAAEIGAQLQDPDPAVKALAASTLGGLGPAAVPHAAGLVPLLIRPASQSGLFLAVDGPVRTAVAALIRLGAVGAPPLAELDWLLHHPDPEVKTAAVEILGKLGPAAVPSLPALIRLLPEPYMGEPVREAVFRMGGAIHTARAAQVSAPSLDPGVFLEAAWLAASSVNPYVYDARWMAYYMAGDSPENQWLIRYLLPRPDPSDGFVPPPSDSEAWKAAVLRLMEVIPRWKRDAPLTTGAAARLATELAREGPAGEEELALLRDLRNTLEENDRGGQAALVETAAARMRLRHVSLTALRLIGVILGSFALGWGLAILFWPRRRAAPAPG